jgi:hypothetical protein
MDASVRVPNLGGRIPSPLCDKKTHTFKKRDVEEESSSITPLWIKSFGNELTLLCVFILILLLMYYVSWESVSPSLEIKRKKSSMEKIFKASDIDPLIAPDYTIGVQSDEENEED